MTTPTERRTMELTQAMCDIMDELHELTFPGGTGEEALLMVAYSDQLNVSSIISMRYVPGKVNPTDLEVDPAAVRNLNVKPQLSLVPKE